MRTSYAPPPRGRSVFATLALGLLVLVVGAAGTLGALYAAGVELPFLKKLGPDRTGLVAVPVSATPIPAYSKVTRDHLIDVKEKQLALTYMRPEDVKPEIIRDLGQIIGRVLKAEKRPGYVFTERDFYPKGTLPGVTAAIPAGKRSFVFDAEKVGGMATLRPGDHFDIIGSMAQDAKGGGRGGNPLVVTGNAPAPPKRATVRPLVQNGVVLTPVTARQVSYSSSSLVGGTAQKSRPVHEITIALDADEVGPLTEALAIDARLTCVARSGLPGGAEEDRDIVVRPADDVKVTTIETIVNGKRQVMTFAEPPAPAAAVAPEPERAPAPRPGRPTPATVARSAGG